MVALRSVVTTLTTALGLLVAAPSAIAQSETEPAGAPPAQAQTPAPAQTARLGQVPTIQLPVSSNTQGAGLTWKANVGAVVSANDTASYQLPKTSFPQVALVAAYDATAHAPIVHRVVLIGSPTVEVRSEPNVKVTVVVGDRTFGPTSTDAKGLARLRIEASPGVSSVKTFATDSYGNVTEGTLPLNPPPFSRLLVLCAEAEEAAYVVEVTEQGEFVSKPSFEANVSEGTAAEPQSVAPGVFRIPLKVQNPTPEWKTVTLKVAHAGFADSCSFKVAPPPPSEPFKLNGSVKLIEPEFTVFVGANAGFATNFGLLAGPWVSLQGSYPFSSTREGLRLELTVGYTRSQSDVSTDDGKTLELTVNSVPILAGPRYVMVWGLLHASAAVHAGTSFTSETLVGELTDQGTTSTPLWLGGDVGVAWWIGRGDVGLNVGYSYAPLDKVDISGNVAGFRATLQYERGF